MGKSKAPLDISESQPIITSVDDASVAVSLETSHSESNDFSKRIMAYFEKDKKEKCRFKVNKKIVLKYGSFITVWAIMYFYSLSAWKNSLEGCKADAMDCLVRLMKAFNSITLSILKFASIQFLILISGLHTSPLPLRLIGISIPIMTYVRLLWTSSNFTFADHSQANFLLCNFFWLVMLLVYLYIRFTIYLVRMRRSWVAALWIVGTTLSATYIVYQRTWNSCSGLQDSIGSEFGDTYSENGGECIWKKSTICWHYVIDGSMKPLFWGRNNCRAENTDLSFYESRAKETKVVGFLNPHSFDLYTFGHFATFRNKMIRESIGVAPDAITDKKNEMEVFLDLREPHNEKLLINLKDYRILHPGTKFLPHDKDHMNILNIFIDTVSRPRFHRKMKKIKEFLKKYHFSQKKDKSVFEFFRHHSLRGVTPPNLLAATYGDYKGVYKQAHKRIETFASENGYVTGLVFDFCSPVEDEVESSSISNTRQPRIQICYNSPASSSNVHAIL